MNNNKKVPNVPNLRFPEFEGEWIKYKVSDLLEFFPTNSLSWDQLSYDSGDLYNLHYGLIHKGAPTQINTDSFQLPCIRVKFTPRTYTRCKDGDVVFADASEDTNDVAKVVEFFNCGEKNVVCGLHTIHGRDKLDITVRGFKGYAFSASPFRNQIKQLAQGAKVYSVSQKNFNECSVGIPPKEEQTKIAHLLRLLNDRIATQSQIIKELETLIRGLITYFVKGKESNAQLKDCLTCHASTLMENTVTGKTGEYPVYGAAGIIAHTPDFEIDRNAILIIKDGASVGKVQYATGKYSVIGTLNYLKPKGKVSLKYFYYYLQTFNFDKYRVGSGIPHIYFKDYGSEPVYCPPIEDQTYIADFLSVIDKKITTERRLLNAYTDQKKYLLTNMFI